MKQARHSILPAQTLLQEAEDIIVDRGCRIAESDGEKVRELICQVKNQLSSLQRQNEALRRRNAELETLQSVLIQNDNLYRALAANIPECAAFIVDHDLRYILAEGRAIHSVGLNSDHFEGKTIHEALEPDLAALYEPHYRAALSGTSIRVEHSSHGRYFQSYLIPLKDDEGNTSSALAVSFDITNQKSAEQELKESEARFRMMAEGLPLIVWVHDEKGRQQYVNKTFNEYFGVAADEMDENSWEKLMHPEDAAAYAEEFLSCLSERRFFNAAVRVRRADGEWRWIESFGKPRLTAEGKFLGMVGTSVDVTDRKEAEAFYANYQKQLESEVHGRTLKISRQYKELQTLNKALRKLSHRTIDAMENERQALAKEIHDGIAGTLAAIKMQLEARVSQLASANQQAPSDAMSLEKIVEHLTNAIKETKHISWQLRSSTLDDHGLKAAYEEHIEHFQQFYTNININMDIDINRDGIPRNIETVLYRIFQEAMNNIGKHSAATEADILLYIDGQNRIHLNIKDNGRGFDLSKAMSEHDSIHGFGLHSMHQRVEICKGTLGIDSQPGKGTEINVSIPIS